MPAYVEHFAQNLRTWTFERVELVHCVLLRVVKPGPSPHSKNPSSKPKPHLEMGIMQPMCVVQSLHVLQVEPTAEHVAHQEQMGKLQQLYGQDALPNVIVQLFNTTLDEPKHAAIPGSSLEGTRVAYFNALLQILLQPESKPIVTRFWLFASCIRIMWLMALLKMPRQLLKVAHVARSSCTPPPSRNSHSMRIFSGVFCDRKIGQD